MGATFRAVIIIIIAFTIGFGSSYLYSSPLHIVLTGVAYGIMGNLTKEFGIFESFAVALGVTTGFIYNGYNASFLGSMVLFFLGYFVTLGIGYAIRKS